MNARSTKNIHDLSNKNLKMSFEIVSNARKEIMHLVNDGIIADYQEGDYILNLYSLFISYFNSIYDEVGDYDSAKISVINEFLSEENLHHFEKNGRKVKNDGSKTLNYLKKRFDALFSIENFFANIARNSWPRYLTDFDDFKNGNEQFRFLIEPLNYEEKDYKKASLITEMQLSMNSSNVGVVYDINNKSVLGSNIGEINLTKQKEDSVLSVLKVNGYNYVSLTNGFNKLLTPDRIIEKNININFTVNPDIFEYDNDVFNEVILDSKEIKPKGILMISNSVDFLFDEYIEAVKKQKELDLDIKVINVGTYRKKLIEKLALNKTKNEVTSKDYVRLRKRLNDFEKKNYLYEFTSSELSSLIKGYKDDILNYTSIDDEVVEIIRKHLDKKDKQIYNKVRGR